MTGGEPKTMIGIADFEHSYMCYQEVAA